MPRRKFNKPRMKPGKPIRSPMVMPRKRKLDARDKMTWFLDFLNVDIDSLKQGDYLKLLFDFREFIHGEPSLEMFPLLAHLLADKSLLKMSQENLKQAVVNILGAEEEVKATGDAHTKTIKEYSVSYQAIVTEDRVFKARDFFIWPPLDKLLDYDTLRDLLFDAVVELLSQFHLSRIRTCQKPGCGKYFYRKREGAKGDFCSRRCRNWGTSTRWRKNHPEEYKKYLKIYRAEAKKPKVKVKCCSCGFHESRGTLYEEMKNNPGLEDCPKCKKAKLIHIGMIREGKKLIERREWGASEWRDFCEDFHEEMK